MELVIRPEDAVVERQTELVADAFDTRRLCACGRMFTPYRTFQRYCSDKCRVKYSKGKASAYVKKSYEVRKCKECGKEFRTNDDKRHYCSDECYQTYQSKRRKPQELRTCLVCGREFTSSHWLKRYCSEECRMEAHKHE